MIYRIEETPSNEGTRAFEVGKNYGWAKDIPHVTKIEKHYLDHGEGRVEVVIVTRDDGSTIQYPSTAIAIFERPNPTT